MTASTTIHDEDGPRCPICGERFVAGVMCATDITEGTCHAECLEGSPVVDLDTGEPSDGPIDTFPWEPWPLPTPSTSEKTDAE
jgi:hypothetical protein